MVVFWLVDYLRSLEYNQEAMIIGVDARSLQVPTPSGVSRYTAGMLAALLAIDDDTEYRLFVNAATDPTAGLPAEKYPGVRWHVGRWPNKLLNTAMRFGRQPTLDALLGGSDVIWVPNAHFLAISPAARLVVTVHDLSCLLQPDLLTLKKRWWHRLIDLPALCRRANRVVTVSETTRRDVIHQIGLDPKRVVTILPGLTPLPAAVALSSLRRRMPLPEQFIFQIATKEPRKNVVAIVQALELLHTRGHRQLGLVVAGGSGWKESALQRRIQASPVKDHIYCLPYVTDAAKHALYRAAVAFVYPSFYEGFGFPPLEAMAAGCPVVASTAGSLPETCGAAAVLVDPHRPSDLAAAVAALITTPGWRAEKIAAGKAWAARYQWAKSAEQLRQVFTDVCALS